MRRLLVGSLAMLLVIPVAVFAQEPSAVSIKPRPNVLSFNPLGIPFEYFSMEYEGVPAQPRSESSSNGGRVGYGLTAGWKHCSCGNSSARAFPFPSVRSGSATTS